MGKWRRSAAIAVAVAAWLYPHALAAQEAVTPVPVGSPASWITAADYPPSALRARAESRVTAMLGVDRTGKVTSCAVQTSSGNASLDAATCAVMTTRGAFTPATGADGKPVASSYVIPVRWAMPKDAVAPPVEVTAATRLDMEVAVELSLDGDGKVLGCRVLSATMPSFAAAPGDQPCSPFRPGMQASPGLRRDGKPVASTVVQRFTRRMVMAP